MSQAGSNSAIAPGGAITTINGDTGSISGSTVTIYADNTAQQAGSSVLFSNSGSTSTFEVTDANFNTIIGKSSGNASLTGISNTFLGFSIGGTLTSGSSNVGIGSGLFSSITQGSHNVAIGGGTLGLLNTGTFNTSIGQQSLESLTTGSYNVALGNVAGSSYTSSESSNIAIGNNGVAAESHVIRIGTQGISNGQQNTCYIAGITGVSVSNQTMVTLNSSTGQLGEVSTVPPANGGTGVSSPTAHTLPVAEGSSNFNFLGPLTNGELLIGSTGLDPVASALTSGMGISITNGAGSITIANSSPLSSLKIDADSGSAAPTAGVVTVSGGTTGLTTTASASTVDLTGTLNVGNGGTGSASFNINGPVISSTTTTGALTALTLGSQELLAGNSSAAPTAKSLNVNVQTFTASGTYTPTAGMIYCMIEAVGSGGGGGGTAVAGASDFATGGGGAGGAYARKFISAATIGVGQIVTIGSRGNGGGPGNNNGLGGNACSFGVICVANGGGGGAGCSGSGTAAGGIGGSGGTGDLLIPGQHGLSGWGNAYISWQGNGGASIWGFGGLISQVTPANGAPGNSYGGGGAGGSSFNGNGPAGGGNGATGVVIVTEYILS